MLFVLRPAFIFVSIFFLVCQSNSLAQEYVKRSIRNWNELMRSDLEALKGDALETIRRGISERNSFAVAVGKRSLGTYLARSGHPEKSLPFLDDAAAFFLKEEDHILSAETYNELGNALVFLSRPKEAIDVYLFSLKEGHKAPDPTAAFLAEINLAQAYLDIGDTNRAYTLIHHYKRKSGYFEKWEAVANSYAILGKIAQAQSKNDLAVEYFRKSAFFGLRSDAHVIRAQAFTNLAIVRFGQGLNETAENLFLKALNLRRKVAQSPSLFEGMFNLAVFYEETGQTDKAIHWYQSAASLAYGKGLISELVEVSKSLSHLYENEGNMEDALYVLRQLSDQEKMLFQQKNERAESEQIQIAGIQQFVGNDDRKRVENSIQQENMTSVVLAAISFILLLLCIWLLIGKARNKKIS